MEPKKSHSILARLGLTQLSHRLWRDHRARQIVRFGVAWAILSIVVAGSMNDAADFAKSLSGTLMGQIGLLVFAFAVGAFLFFVRRELRPFATGGIPLLEEVRASDRLRFGPLTRTSHVDDIARIAEAVFKGDAMPRELIAELHWHSRDSVFVLEDPNVGVVGYVSLMVPTPALKAQIMAGQTDPLKWSASDFVADANRWRAGWVYLESVAVWPKTPTYTLILYRHIVSYFEELFASGEVGANHLEVFGLAASESGRSLLQKTLRLKLHSPKEHREDEMDLFLGSLSRRQLSVIRAQVDATFDGYLQRRMDLPWE